MRTSLRTKTIVLIIMIAAILSVVGMLVSSRYINKLVEEEYRHRAEEISDTVAVIIDAERFKSLAESILKIYHETDQKVTSDEWGSPEFEEYISKYSQLENSEDFQYLLGQLRKIQDVNDVDCLYLSLIDAPTEGFIYAVDAATEDACPPGCLDPVYEENRDLLTDPTRGFPAYITNSDPYGWLVTAGAPVYDENKKVIGYAMADISMDVIRANQRRFIMSFAVLLALITIVICFVCIWIVNRAVIGPINKLSNAAANYSAGDKEPDFHVFEHLHIHTRDEIESLCNTMKSMLVDMSGYIDSLKSTTKELSETRIEADEMGELARRDLLTGVWNKNAYKDDIVGISDNLATAKFGIAVIDLNDLKKLNDQHGHDKGDQAIKNLCDMICDVFKNSPVYRFGGDEFVVVLIERDYEDAEKLVDRFIRLQEKLDGEPWEVSRAAIGYASYDPQTDVSVDSVFRRADSRMYHHKKEMKS